MEENWVPISALQHFAFCPRQCALIHIERQWAENYLTAQGQQLHQRVDQGVPEKRKGVRFERAVEVTAHRQDRLLSIYDAEHDSLRFYQLGKNWRRRVEHHGAKAALDLFADVLAI